MPYTSTFFARLRLLALRREFERKVSRRLGRDMDKEVGSTAFAPIPKIIWMYWQQGWDEAPDLVKRCRQNWERLNPGWTVRALDASNYAEYTGEIKLPKAASVQNRADLLRIMLLQKHGGVWADATTLCQTPLDDWLPLVACRGFFAYSAPFKDRMLSNWFLAAAPSDPLVSAWVDVMTAFWSQPNARAYVYAIAHYMFELAVRSDKDLLAQWNLVPKISAQPAHVCQQYLKGAASEEDVLRLIRSGGAVVHKLTHKIKIGPEKLDWLIDQITAADKKEFADPANRVVDTVS